MVKFIIKDRHGNITREGGRAVCDSFFRRKHLRWGDHYRVMKRRKDPTSLVLHDRDTGDTLHRDPPLER